jgi:hypothetical protein
MEMIDCDRDSWGLGRGLGESVVGWIELLLSRVELVVGLGGPMVQCWYGRFACVWLQGRPRRSWSVEGHNTPFDYLSATQLHLVFAYISWSECSEKESNGVIEIEKYVL